MDSIKIGGIDYAIVRKELKHDDGVQLGWCKYVEATIEINNHDVNEQKQTQTIIHEMTHAIIHEAGLGFGDDDERVTNHLALILHQVLKDNDFSWVRD